MLALGDALAVALLKRRGFSADDFQRPASRRHSSAGGCCGSRDLMHAGDEMPLVARACAWTRRSCVMTAKRFGCVGIVDGDGRLVGIITDGDLRRHMDGRSAPDRGARS